ncbi:MAG: hypothetical protein NC406_09545, partial [Bacteroides sp.]|nr:hypothetical protein [Bacteroides sp.]
PTIAHGGRKAAGPSIAPDDGNAIGPTIAHGDRSAAEPTIAHGGGDVGGNAAPLDVNRKNYLAVIRSDRYVHPKGMPLTD